MSPAATPQTRDADDAGKIYSPSLRICWKKVPNRDGTRLGFAPDWPQEEALFGFSGHLKASMGRKCSSYYSILDIGGFRVRIGLSRAGRDRFVTAGARLSAVLPRAMRANTQASEV